MISVCTLVWASLLAVAQCSDLSFVQPSEDRYVLVNDSLALRWSDYILGSGKQLVTITKPFGILPDNSTVVEMSNRSIETQADETLDCKSSVHLDKYVLSICDKKFVWRTSIVDLEEKSTKLSVGPNLECFSLQTASPLLETAFMICQNSDTSTNKSLVLVGVQPDPLQILYTWEIPQSEQQAILSTSDFVRLTAVHSHKMLNMTEDVFFIYNPDNRAVRFRAVSIKGKTPETFKSLGYFDATTRTTSQVDLAKDCVFINIQVGFPYVNMAFWCNSKQANVYLRCPISSLSADTPLNCPADLTLEEKDQPKPQGMYLLQDRVGAVAYAIKFDGVLVLDFPGKAVRKVFNLSDGFGENPAVSYKTAAIFGEYGYVLQLQREPEAPKLLRQTEGQTTDSWSLWCYTFNFEKNYYVGQKMLSDIPRTEIELNSTVAIFEEDLFGGSQPYIFVISSRFRKFFIFDTIEHAMVLDTKSSSKVRPDDFFNTSKVNVTVASGDAKRRVAFDVKIINDISTINIFNPPKEWMVYRGKESYTLPVANEEFMGYGSNLSASQSSLNPTIEYFNKVELQIPEFGDVNLMKSDQGGEVLLISESNYTAMACKTTPSTPPKNPQASVSCKTLFAKDMRQGQFIMGFIIADSLTYILSKDGNQMTVELIENTNGVVKSSVTLPYSNRLAQIREFNSFVIFETIGYDANDNLVLNYASVTLGSNFDPNKIKSFSEFYKENITPVSLEKGSRKANSIFIETTSQERFKILELGYNMQMEPTNNKEVELNKSISAAKTCYFTKYAFIADLTNQKVFIVSRGTNPPNTKEYPFVSFGLEKVEDLQCDYDTSQVIAKTKTEDDKLVLVIYRVEDGPLEALRRVHTILRTDSANAMLVVTLGSIQDPDSSTLLIYDTQAEAKPFTAYNYQLYTPKISFSLGDQTDKKVGLDISYSVEQSESKRAHIDIIPVDQDRSISVGLYNKAPVSPSGQIELDHYLSVDGLGVRAELSNVADSLKDKLKLTPRVVTGAGRTVPKFSTAFSKMVFSESLAVAWKDDRIGIAELNQKDQTEAPFEMTIKSLRECQIIEDSRVVSCYARTSDLEASKVYLLQKSEKESKWVWVESSVNFMIRKVKTFQLEPALFTFAMMDINNEIINVGTFAQEDSTLVAKGRFLNYVQNKKMNAFDVLSIQKKLLVVKNDLGAKTVTFMEYGFDHRLNRIAMKRSHNLPIFDSDISEFNKPVQLKCHKNETLEYTDVFCFGAQEGVHSFIAQVRFPVTPDLVGADGVASSTSVSRIFGRKVFNVQGFSVVRVKVVQNWAMITAIRNQDYTKTVDGITSKVILLVYKIDQIYSHPYALIPLDDLKLTEQEVHKIEISASVFTIPKPKLSVTLFYSEPKEKYTLQSFNISSFELVLPSDFKSTYRGQTQVVFTSAYTAQPVKKLLTELVFVDAISEDSSWFTSAKFLITVTVVIIAFVVLIGCFHACRRVQKLSKERSSAGESSGSFLPAGDTSKTMDDDHYMRVNEKEGDTRI